LVRTSTTTHPVGFYTGGLVRYFRWMHSRLSIACAVASALAVAVPVLGEDPLPGVERLQSSPVLRHLKPNPLRVPAVTGPEKTVAQMFVPEGFRVDLVAGEPDLHQPIAFAFDERGRIWIAEAYSYPTRRAEGQGRDKLVILEDTDGDGRFETRKVFAEGLNLVSGFEVGHGGVWVGAAPQLLFIADRNHDDIPDGKPEVLLDGFGYQDTHECLNSFLWGPDGWLYGNQGVFNLAHIGKPGAPAEKRTELRAGVWRYHPVRHEFEVFANGGSNPWGLDYDERGELFMTHCRSYWGRGLTTHVVQGGHYWNQANANHAPFIVGNPPADFPDFGNYLLASARYDHGAGGAGVKGSDAIYGGHSHVGTMVYLGDNWPAEYRGQLFTHNLGGHQMNRQVNRPLGSGFDTVHAGSDQLFCTDPMYVAVDLQYGPDGAVYFIDWYDRQHCHNPDTERWDRSNGRIYRMQWQATYKPVKVDLGSMDDIGLVGLLEHPNAWHGRTARRLLQERATTGTVSAAAAARLGEIAAKDPDAVRRLEAYWSLHLVGRPVEAALADSDPSVRGWGVRLSTDVMPATPAVEKRLATMAGAETSPVARRFLASAIQRVSAEPAWTIAASLASHGEDADDRNIPMLLWDGLAQRMPSLPDRAFAIAATTRLPRLADWIWWYAATQDGAPLDRSVAEAGKAEGELLKRRLAGLWLAIEPRAGVPMPPSWAAISKGLYANGDVGVRRLAESLGAVFGDVSMLPRLRDSLADTGADAGARRHAFTVLSRAADREFLPVFLGLLDDPAFRTGAIDVVARFDAPVVPAALLSRFDGFKPEDRAAALGALTRRPSFALALLDAVAAGTVGRDQISAFQIRAMAGLGNLEVDRRVAAAWGRIGRTPAEKQELMTSLEKVFNEAPLWAYSGDAGRKHFQRLCAQCHRIGEEGVQLGPELTGAGQHGVRYFLENVIDPDTVIGSDFQLTVVETKAGDTIQGLVVAETASALTLRATGEPVVIDKSEIAKRERSERSLMPAGLLESLGDRERIELLKFLTSN
jgi:putative membrane-bound dehydrogenase-like protein